MSRMIDAHLHLWDLAVSEYAWLGPRNGVLHATFGPESAAAAIADADVGQVVLVQAEDSVRDTEYLLDVAAQHSFVAGVVGWVRLEEPDTTAGQLDVWRRSAAFRGVRHLVHDDPREDFLELSPVRRSLARIAGHGLTFDVPDAWPRHLGQVVEVARALPELVVVVDHLAKPPYGRRDWTGWARTLAEVARQPNTMAKVSGLQAPGRPFTADEIRPAVHTALELFGPERLMYGGDWPLTVPFGGYRKAWDVYAEIIGELSPSEQEHLWWRTAVMTYGLSDPTVG